MRIETICTGDELLTGLTSDTNSRFFQEQLLEHTGQVVRRSVVVRDLQADIVEALDAAVERCDFVLVSGGLGPTSDDVTVEAAAQAAHVDVVEHPAVRAHLEERYRQRMSLTPNNLRQARIPQGCDVVLNDVGSAPLIIQRRGSCTLFFVPGVPHEYRHLVETHVISRIKASLGHPSTRLLRVLKTIGVPESHLDARLTPIAQNHPRVTFGYRTHAPENHVKLLAEGTTEAEAQKALDAAEQATRAELKTACFGADSETLPSVVVTSLRRCKARLALAESCTGGLVAQLITQVPGASDVFYGAAVTYLEVAKTKWAGVPEGLLAQFSAVSSECAEAMASGLLRETQVDYTLSITGYAGPTGGTTADPVGTVYIGLAGPQGVSVQRCSFSGDRERVRRFAAHTALDLLRVYLATRP